MSNSKTVTRRELYDLIWDRPLRDVAKDFGLSDVGLAKICTRHKIPKPPRGYWAQIHAGWKIKPTPLPDDDEAGSIEIDIRSTLSTIPEAARRVLKEARDKVESSNPEDTEVNSTPAIAATIHPLLVSTARELRKGKPSEDGGLYATREGMCGVVVSAAQSERAIAVLNALIKILTTEGVAIAATGGQTTAAIEPDSVSFTLRERTRRETHSPTAEELATEERRKKKLQSRWNRPDRLVDLVMSDYRCSYPEFDIIYTGELAVEISGWGGHGLRRRWSDGKRQKLEPIVSDIAVGIRAYLAAVKANREANEKRQREWAHLEHRRDLARRRADREARRQGFLDQLFEGQQESRRLATILENAAALRATHPELDRMLEWAESRQRSLAETMLPNVVAAALQRSDLFPEMDSLFDPEGDPPAGYSW